jgi:hypothetical protein
MPQREKVGRALFTPNGKPEQVQRNGGRNRREQEPQLQIFPPVSHTKKMQGAGQTGITVLSERVFGLDEPCTK